MRPCELPESLKKVCLLLGVAREGLRAAAAAGACPPCRRSRSRVGACPRMVAVRHGRRRRHHTGSSLHPFGLPRGGQHRWWSLVVAVRRRAPCEDPRRRAWGTPSPGGLGRSSAREHHCAALSLSLSLSARSFGDPSCGDPNSKLFWMRPYREVSEEKKKKTESSSEGSRPAAKDGDEGGEQKGVELERPLRGSH